MIIPIGYASGTVPLACDCGHESIDMAVYAGGVTVCRSCHDAGVVLCSCGHVASEGRDYPDGTRRCSSCADVHDRASAGEARREAARNQQLQSHVEAKLRENVKRAIREMRETKEG